MSWPIVALEDVTSLITCGVAKRPDYVDFGIPFLSAKNVKNGKVIFDGYNCISEDTHRTLTKHNKPRRGDILYTRVGSVGEAAIVDTDNEFSVFVSLTLIKVDPEKIYNVYLKHLLNSEQFKKRAHDNLTGIGVGNLNVAVVRKFPIPLPPLAEQKRIAAILDKADAIRRKRQQAIQLADDFLRAVFLDMFGDPVTNPKGWEVKKLGDICSVGSSKRVFVDEFVEAGVPFYRGTEVGKLGENEEIFPELFISEEHYRHLIDHSGKPEIGDLLLPSICPDGRIWKVNHEAPFYFKDGRVLWIKAGKSYIDSDYLRGYLQRIFFSNYASIASGTTFAELKIVALKNLDILVPSQTEQTKFRDIFKSVERNIAAQTIGAELVETGFASLSQKAFAGQV